MFAASPDACQRAACSRRRCRRREEMSGVMLRVLAPSYACATLLIERCATVHATTRERRSAANMREHQMLLMPMITFIHYVARDYVMRVPHARWTQTVYARCYCDDIRALMSCRVYADDMAFALICCCLCGCARYTPRRFFFVGATLSAAPCVRCCHVFVMLRLTLLYCLPLDIDAAAARSVHDCRFAATLLMRAAIYALCRAPSRCHAHHAPPRVARCHLAARATQRDARARYAARRATHAAPECFACFYCCHINTEDHDVIIMPYRYATPRQILRAPLRHSAYSI